MSFFYVFCWKALRPFEGPLVRGSFGRLIEEDLLEGPEDLLEGLEAF